jgi:hypothetical protein
MPQAQEATQLLPLELIYIKLIDTLPRPNFRQENLEKQKFLKMTLSLPIYPRVFESLALSDDNSLSFLVELSEELT